MAQDYSYTILCVDDEDFILKGLERLLGLEGYRVLTAPSGEKALEILEKESIDLILADQRMPGMDGAELLSIVKKKYPHIIRIMVSGYSDFSRLVTAINEGEIYRFIAKPWDPQELKETIAIALEQRNIVRLVNNFYERLKKELVLGESIKLEVNQDPGAVNILVSSLEKEKLFSEEIISQFLNLFLESITPDEQTKEKLKVASGVISRQKGRIVFIIDFSKGLSIRLEFS